MTVLNKTLDYREGYQAKKRKEDNCMLISLEPVIHQVWWVCVHNGRDNKIA